MSASVLKALTSGKTLVGVTAHRWQPGMLPVAIEHLRAKVLCTNHNESAAPLDGEMGRLVRALFDMEAVLTANNPSSHAVHVFDGELIERWLVKALCGAVRSGQFNGIGGRAWVPPVGWLKLLFEGPPLSPGFGLYIGATGNPEAGTIVRRDVYFKHLIGRRSGVSMDTALIGCSLWVYGLRFSLLLPTADRRNAFIVSENPVIYRPDEIRWDIETRWVSIQLKWKRPRRVNRVTLPIRWEQSLSKMTR